MTGDLGHMTNEQLSEAFGRVCQELNTIVSEGQRRGISMSITLDLSKVKVGDKDAT